MIKVLKLGIEGNYFNIIKSTYQKPTANTTLNVDKLRSSARSGRRQRCLLLLLLFNLVLDNLEVRGSRLQWKSNCRCGRNSERART